MKNLFLISNLILVISISLLYSCSENEQKLDEKLVITDTTYLINDTIKDTCYSDLDKVNKLIQSTINADKKITEIKVMKKENLGLKKELIETKKELSIANEKIKMLDSSIKTNEKKGFIRKLIDNVKGEKDTIK